MVYCIYFTKTVISNSMDTLKMGDSIAISLGENVKLTKICKNRIFPSIMFIVLN